MLLALALGGMLLANAGSGGASRAAGTPPTAAFTVSPGGSALARTFDASASSDDGTIQAYAWDFGDGASGSGVTASHTYASPGSYQVKLTVTDDTASTGELTKTVTINAPPTAVFAPDVPDPEDPLRLRFDASASTDTDGTISSYAWTFGDGQTGTGKVASHAYAQGGTYTVALTVTDDDGATAQTSTSVTVNRPPVAAFTASRGADSLTFVFDASASTDPDGSIVSYEWDFDDGRFATGKTASHAYVSGDTYDVTLTVTDDKGAVAEVDHEVVANEPPEASLDCEVSDDDPNLVECDGSDSEDPDSDGEIVAWSWSFGDGGTASGEQVTHRYTRPGTFTITLTVTDNGGVTGSDSDSVRINAPPAPAFTVAYDPANPLAITVDGTASKDPDGAVRSWDWSFGDGEDGFGKVATHTYDRYGVYTVTLTVEDDDLAETPLRQKVYVVFARGGYLVKLGGGAAVALDARKVVLGLDCATGQRLAGLVAATVTCRDGFAPLPSTFLAGADGAAARALAAPGPVQPAARASVEARRSFRGAGAVEARWTALERALSAAVGSRPPADEPVEVDPAGGSGTALDAAYASWLKSVDELLRLGTAGSAAGKALAKGLAATPPPAGGWVVAPGLVVGGPRVRVVGIDCTLAVAVGRAVPAARPKGCRGGVALARAFLAGQARAAARAFTAPSRVAATVRPDARRSAAYLASAGALELRWKTLVRAVAALRLPPNAGARRTARPTGAPATALRRAGNAWLASLEDVARIEAARAVALAALRAGLTTPAS